MVIGPGIVRCLSIITTKRKAADRAPLCLSVCLSHTQPLTCLRDSQSVALGWGIHYEQSRQDKKSQGFMLAKYETGSCSSLTQAVEAVLPLPSLSGPSLGAPSGSSSVQGSQSAQEFITDTNLTTLPTQTNQWQAHPVLKH